MSARARTHPHETSCTIELTRDEREMLNCLLAIAVQRPELFGGESRTLCGYFERTMTGIREKLPVRSNRTLDVP
ncbi:MAG TPA: hypothetical protein VGH54_18555 [Mycobacterium sp.]|jgi:hypothetical protein|uniref:hypothetical protein n=1 Tax=Mycobacterium sp. TaxID=1785 RepID=UPI002F3FB610